MRRRSDQSGKGFQISGYKLGLTYLQGYTKSRYRKNFMFGIHELLLTRDLGMRPRLDYDFLIIYFPQISMKFLK